ncbi:MAG: NAD-dependent epimerase/dehydratase family protein [Candidatus Hydrogenedentota bacterium]|nr:MAG: NAD-dependent epimerase/dehydratase family protein [Candidatus Hydrogenedentota bacterium]
MSLLSGKKVLVTGGTGSFGRYVVNRLLAEDVAEIRIFSRDEKKQFDMRHRFSDPRVRFFLGDVRDRTAVEEAMGGVEVVFHAAALKQVPHCEKFPTEAIGTNVLGARNVVQAAIEEAVEAVIAISTDKAVQPVNVMGMTKALQERLLANAQNSTRNRGTRFLAVRYGNVLNSRGSVVPFFRNLLRRGKRLTITNPDMTRFLLTLNQAVDLVLYAYREGRGGELFVRKAPSARIVDLAKAVCELAGAPCEYDIIGIYPGEKIHEILISEEERTRCEEQDEYFLIHPWRQDPKIDYEVEEYNSRDHVVSVEEIKRMIEEADRAASQIDFEEGYFSR